VFAESDSHLMLVCRLRSGATVAPGRNREAASDIPHGARAQAHANGHLHFSRYP